MKYKKIITQQVKLSDLQRYFKYEINFIGENLGRAELVKKFASSQTKAKRGLRAGAVATAVAKKVASSVKQQLKERGSKVAASAAQVGTRIVNNVARGFSKSRIVQKAPTLMRAGQLKSSKATVSASKAPLPVAPKKKLSAKALGLSASQLRDLEKRLHLIQVELKEQLDLKSGVFNAAAHTESVIKGDDAEVAEKQRVSSAALQEIDFLKNRLSLVARALAKIEVGVFGLCEETEEPIGYERLSVVPWARFSVNVQEMHERKMKDYKVNRLRAEG
jgi:DnaK suppressor protein